MAIMSEMERRMREEMQRYGYMQQQAALNHQLPPSLGLTQLLGSASQAVPPEPYKEEPKQNEKLFLLEEDE